MLKKQRSEWPAASEGTATETEITLASYATVNFFKGMGEDQVGCLFAWAKRIIELTPDYSEDGLLAQGDSNALTVCGEERSLLDNARLWLEMSCSKKKGVLAPVQKDTEENHSLSLNAGSIEW